ncbi:hypothetical protein ACKI13_48370, partial [Streptomyces scabiei]
MALYGIGFGGYAASFFGPDNGWLSKAFGLGLVVLMAVINMVGSALVSRSELVVVTVELIILAIFLGFATAHLDPGVFATAAT